eukprot:3342614-Prorocentrum_lima.AAC.1
MKLLVAGGMSRMTLLAFEPGVVGPASAMKKVVEIVEVSTCHALAALAALPDLEKGSSHLLL